jgi:sec-independent protein translocase protein TatA
LYEPISHEGRGLMLGNLQGWHLIVILAIVLLLFGAPKLPGLARSVGQSMRIFKSEVKTMKSDDPKSDEAAASGVSNVSASTIAEPAPVAKPVDVTVADVRPADLHATESNNKL